MRNFKEVFNKVESMLLKLCFLSILLLIGLQFIVGDNDLLAFFNEGSKANDFLLEDSNVKQKGIIILKTIGTKKYENLEVLVNGEVVEKFGDLDEIEIRVYENDLIEINGIMYQNKVKIKVVGLSKNVLQPKLNSIVETSQSIEILGRVDIK